jgi:hypothetical protein
MLLLMHLIPHSLIKLVVWWVYHTLSPIAFVNVSLAQQHL